jgi:hypothetical protein
VSRVHSTFSLHRRVFRPSIRDGDAEIPTGLRAYWQGSRTRWTQALSPAISLVVGKSGVVLRTGSTGKRDICDRGSTSAEVASCCRQLVN